MADFTDVKYEMALNAGDDDLHLATKVDYEKVHGQVRPYGKTSR